MDEIKCNLIVDSCCDLPHEMVEQDHVFLIRFPFFFGEDEYLDDMWQTRTAHEFYEDMREGGTPHTAAASFETVMDAFRAATADGAEAVYLSFSSGLSGHFEQVMRVYDMFKEERPEAVLHVVDSRCACTPEGLLVMEAMRQQRRGMTARELADWAEEARYFVTTFFMVDNFDALRRGGRIPSSVAFAGTKLDVKPILTFALDGTLAMKGFARGRKKGMKQLVDLYRQYVDKETGSEVVLCGNADAPAKDVKHFEEMVMQGDDAPKIYIGHSIGPVIGSHVGPGMMSIAFWGTDRRDDLSISDRIARKVKGEA